MICDTPEVTLPCSRSATENLGRSSRPALFHPATFSQIKSRGEKSRRRDETFTFAHAKFYERLFRSLSLFMLGRCRIFDIGPENWQPVVRIAR